MIPLLSSSQTIYREEIKGREIIATEDSSGEVYLHMHIETAKILLVDILDYEFIVDSIIPNYKLRDSLNSNLITLQVSKIEELQSQSDNHKQQNEQLWVVIDNLKKISGFKDLTIDNAESKINLERIKKTLGFVGAGIGGVAVGAVAAYIYVKFID
jgi:hypothetical protein